MKSQLKNAAAKAWTDCFKENEATGGRTLRIYGDDALTDNYLTELAEDYEFVNHTGLRCHVENTDVNTFNFSITLVEVAYDDIKADTYFHNELDEDEEDYPIARGIETVEDDNKCETCNKPAIHAVSFGSFCCMLCDEHFLTEPHDGNIVETKGQLGALEEDKDSVITHSTTDSDENSWEHCDKCGQLYPYCGKGQDVIMGMCYGVNCKGKSKYGHEDFVTCGHCGSFNDEEGEGGGSDWLCEDCYETNPHNK